MASSKSTIKVIDKTDLYFKKYSYKASIAVDGVYWIRVCDNIDRFIELVQQRYEEWETQKDRYPNGWYREPPSLAVHDLDLIEYIIKTKNSLNNADVRFRHEYETFSIYTNDEKFIRKIEKHKKWEIEQVQVSPTGVKYFKKDPPAKFRTYLTNNKVDPEFVADMKDYLKKTSDMFASNAFYDWLQRGRQYSYSYCWLHSSHFIDYDDEKNLMMMHLKFPGAIGKTYKLEKKPS